MAPRWLEMQARAAAQKAGGPLAPPASRNPLLTKKEPGTGFWHTYLAARKARLAGAAGPTPPDALLGGPKPPDATEASSAAQQAAIAAAARQRKKASGAGRALLPGQPTGAGRNPGATLQPRALIGY